MLNLIAIIFLCLSLIMSWRVMRTLKSASLDYMRLKTMAADLNVLVGQSKSNLEEMRFLLEQADTKLNHKINEANLIIDDVKFVSARAERIMDTIQRFIDMDNKLKATVSTLLASEKTTERVIPRSSQPQTTSFARELSDAKKQQYPAEQSQSPLGSTTTLPNRQRTFNLRDLAMKIVSSPQ